MIRDKMGKGLKETDVIYISRITVNIISILYARLVFKRGRRIIYDRIYLNHNIFISLIVSLNTDLKV